MAGFKSECRPTSPRNPRRLKSESANIILTQGSIAFIAFGNALDNTITGNTGDNLFLGGDGNDTLNGGDGNDSLSGEAGINFLSGEAGDDEIYTDSTGDAVSGGDGIDIVVASYSFTLPDDCENLIVYNSSNGTGNALGNQITGGNGDNTLNGLGGDDQFFLSLGIDQIFGGDGFDTLNFETLTLGAVTVAAFGADGVEIKGTINGFAFQTFITSVENFIFNGVNHTLAEMLAAAPPVSPPASPPGTPPGTPPGVVVPPGIDPTPGATVSDIIGTNKKDKLIGTADGERIFGLKKDDRLFGNGGDDMLYGGRGKDRLSGGEGDDVLCGGRGADRLRGGEGNDSFLFGSKLRANEVDRIKDFSVADDTILLDNATFKALGEGALAAGSFHIGTEAADADDHILYNAKAGTLAYDADGKGGAAAKVFATVSKDLLLTDADFLVV